MTKAMYPGDSVECTIVERGPDGQEGGDIRIQEYSPDNFRVGSFLPGIVVQHPGDSHKVEPERSEWCNSLNEAATVYRQFIAEAIADGWKVP